MNLYEMTAQAQQLFELLEAGEIDEQTYKDTLEAIGTDEKLESYCQVLKQLNFEAKAFKDEEARMKARRQAIENNMAKLKATMLDFMNAGNQKKIKTAHFTVSTSENERLQIITEEAIPNEFITTETKINRAELKKAIKDGLTVDGVTIEKTQSVMVR